MSDERLRVDFDACVTLYQDYIRQTSKGKPNSSVNISELKTSGGKRKSEAIEDRYYTKEEYAALSPEQKRSSPLNDSNAGINPVRKTVRSRVLATRRVTRRLSKTSKR
jgi:hypothetical protein